MPLADDPAVEALAKEIASRPRNAVLWTRSAIPTAGSECTSYFGGLPRLPPNLQWPRLQLASSWDGSRAPGSPTFLGQIDFADIAAFARAERLPSSGVLYFFCDTCFVDGEPAHKVLFAPEGCADCPERAPPDDLMRLAETSFYSGRDWRGNDEPFGRIDFRYALTPHVFKSYQGWSETGDEHRYGAAHDKVQIPALEKVFGPLTPEDRTAEMTPSERADKTGWQGLMFPSWPCSRRFYEEFRRAFEHLLKGARPSGEIKPPVDADDPVSLAFYTQIKADLARWSAEIAAFEDDAPLPGELRNSIRAWFIATRARALDLYYGSGSVSEKAVVFEPWELSRTRDDSMWFAANAAIAAPNAMGGWDGATLRAALKHRVERWTYPMYNMTTRIELKLLSRPMHQTLGYGERCQSAAEDHAGDVLLLQLSPRDCLGWQGRYSSMLLQFWIKPKDLAAKRFDRVEMTSECD